MKVAINMVNGDVVEHHEAREFKIENGFLIITVWWRNRPKKIGYNKDDVRKFEFYDIQPTNRKH